MSDQVDQSSPSGQSDLAEDSSGFVTVAVAASRLGLDARQVRRWIPLLDLADKTTDTQRTHKGQPIVIVRMSAVEKLKNKRYSSSDQSKEQTKKPTDSGTGQLRDNLRTDKGHVRTSVDSRDSGSAKDELPPLMVALLTEKDARITELSKALEIEREAHRRAEVLHLNTQGELMALRQRAADLEAQTANLIAALPTIETRENIVVKSPQGTERHDITSGVTSASPTLSEEQRIGKQPAKDNRPWWERLKFWEK